MVRGVCERLEAAWVQWTARRDELQRSVAACAFLDEAGQSLAFLQRLEVELQSLGQPCPRDLGIVAERSRQATALHATLMGYEPTLAAVRDKAERLLAKELRHGAEAERKQVLDATQTAQSLHDQLVSDAAVLVQRLRHIRAIVEAGAAVVESLDWVQRMAQTLAVCGALEDEQLRVARLDACSTEIGAGLADARRTAARAQQQTAAAANVQAPAAGPSSRDTSDDNGDQTTGSSDRSNTQPVEHVAEVVHEAETLLTKVAALLQHRDARVRDARDALQTKRFDGLAAAVGAWCEASEATRDVLTDTVPQSITQARQRCQRAERLGFEVRSERTDVDQLQQLAAEAEASHHPSAKAMASVSASLHSRHDALAVAVKLVQQCAQSDLVFEQFLGEVRQENQWLDEREGYARNGDDAHGTANSSVPSTPWSLLLKLLQSSAFPRAASTGDTADAADAASVADTSAAASLTTALEVLQGQLRRRQHFHTLFAGHRARLDDVGQAAARIAAAEPALQAAMQEHLELLVQRHSVLADVSLERLKQLKACVACGVFLQSLGHVAALVGEAEFLLDTQLPVDVAAADLATLQAAVRRLSGPWARQINGATCQAVAQLALPSEVGDAVSGGGSVGVDGDATDAVMHLQRQLDSVCQQQRALEGRLAEAQACFVFCAELREQTDALDACAEWFSGKRRFVLGLAECEDVDMCEARLAALDETGSVALAFQTACLDAPVGHVRRLLLAGNSTNTDTSAGGGAGASTSTSTPEAVLRGTAQEAMERAVKSRDGLVAAVESQRAETQQRLSVLAFLHAASVPMAQIAGLTRTMASCDVGNEASDTQRLWKAHQDTERAVASVATSVDHLLAERECLCKGGDEAVAEVRHVGCSLDSQLEQLRAALARRSELLATAQQQQEALAVVRDAATWVEAQTQRLTTSAMPQTRASCRDLLTVAEDVRRNLDARRSTITAAIEQARQCGAVDEARARAGNDTSVPLAAESSAKRLAHRLAEASEGLERGADRLGLLCEAARLLATDSRALFELRARVEAAEAWLGVCEKHTPETLGHSVTEVKTLLLRQVELEQAIAAHSERFAALHVPLPFAPADFHGHLSLLMP
eukprot:m.7978 g.7978  ORF g.7978 m.7978 type:complete len:1108 (-) comp3087_c0_seq1:25-3348(-)